MALGGSCVPPGEGRATLGGGCGWWVRRLGGGGAVGQGSPSTRHATPSTGQREGPRLGRWRGAAHLTCLETPGGQGQGCGGQGQPASQLTRPAHRPPACVAGAVSPHCQAYMIGPNNVTSKFKSIFRMERNERYCVHKNEKFIC